MMLNRDEHDGSPLNSAGVLLSSRAMFSSKARTSSRGAEHRRPRREHLARSENMTPPDGGESKARHERGGKPDTTSFFSYLATQHLEGGRRAVGNYGTS